MIRDLREARGLTRAELAELVGISESQGHLTMRVLAILMSPACFSRWVHLQCKHQISLRRVILHQNCEA